jgi:pimeloyl-ACP methyl ester carboxylesterase
MFLGGFTQRLTRWPLNISEARRQAPDLHHPVGRDPTTGGFASTWTVMDGVEVHARVSESPPDHAWPIVLVHGLAVSHRYLMPTAALLARRHPVGVPDLPGFGLSGDPRSALDTTRLGDALGGWLHAARLPSRGLSSTGVRWAKRHVRVRAPSAAGQVTGAAS